MREDREAIVKGPFGDTSVFCYLVDRDLFKRKAFQKIYERVRKNYSAYYRKHRSYDEVLCRKEV